MMILATGNNEPCRGLNAITLPRAGANSSLRRAGRGFTFLELLIVIVIIGVLMGLSAPSLSVSARKFAFSQTVSRVYSLLRYLQRHAIAEQRAYRLVIAPRGEEKRVERLNAEAGAEQWEAWPSSLIAETLGGSVLEWRNDDSITIVLYPNGSASSSELALQDGRGGRAMIRTSLSGEIKIEAPA